MDRVDNMNKYRNKPVVIDGILFLSMKEGARYQVLKLQEKAREISDLILQPQFVLQDGFIDDMGKRHRKIIYKGDFQYLDKIGRAHVEDVKGYRTDVYKLKVKLLLNKFHGFHFHEV